ncbi:integrin alpha FG-GAP repeat-containing protein 2 [Tyrophagus putrescentiae]|nr:integrin alpha FG-GAP repeat-containing protein 2 [Tyrophagus putrescentiae]
MNSNNSQASLNSFGQGGARGATTTTTNTNNNNNETASSTSSSSRTSICASQAGAYNAQNSLNYRSISLIDSIQFKFEGNLSKNGVVLADCDNDDKNELLIGTLNGELLIFKDSSTIPLATAKELGMISCIVVGDILNKNRNSIITISIEGYLNIFAFHFELAHDAAGHSHTAVSLNPTRRGSNFSTVSVPLSSVKCPPTITDNEEFGGQQHPSVSNSLICVHAQQIQANAMSALIADIDADGSNELIVALSDRVVRSYRAVQYGEEIKLVGIHKWEFSDQIGSITLSTSWENVVPTAAASTNAANGSQKSGSSDHSNGGGGNGIDRQERKSVLVAQHGGMYAKVHSSDVVVANSATSEDNSVELVMKNGGGGGGGDEASEEDVIDDDEEQHLIEQAIGLRPEYKTITPVPPLRNPQISAEIVADIATGSATTASSSSPDSSESDSNGNGNSNSNRLIAVATADGLLLLLEEEHIKWQLQLEQKIACLRKHDIDGDGRDELVACTWNGQTYLVNLDTRIVSCQFDQPIAAFTVGHYHLNDRRMTVLVYGTFTCSVHLYYNVDCAFNVDTSSDGPHLLGYIRASNETLAGQLETLVRRLNESRVGEGEEEVETEEGENAKRPPSSETKFKVDAKLIEALLYGSFP